ncbi:PREDICTED: orofacial cleft 1 candidate gene 1 protein homolog, partial [Thamnophis sirtalis]|uniref:Orofacial cleft 1 candidate gene 1 protein homolog n=1 Tax=Thamnophis sirtalis TaxID=35019 RepID=A0A6I9YBK7_9SAUR
KFQQKARKQTKQKKSKSSDFLMAELCSMTKDEKVSIEVFENAALNISNTDISTHQTGLIRYDKLTSSLAAHPQKLRLRAQTEPRGEISPLIIISLSDNGYVLDLTCPFHVDSSIVS